MINISNFLLKISHFLYKVSCYPLAVLSWMGDDKFPEYINDPKNEMLIFSKVKTKSYVNNRFP